MMINTHVRIPINADMFYESVILASSRERITDMF